MSLTNPDKLVTEERLNEYHNTILPYLGGMPDILANKFSRGDMYSTDEKMIGQWIDGKPIYQKVVVFQNEITVTTSWSNLGIDIENLDKIIYCAGYKGSALYPLNADYDIAIPTLQAMACRASGADLIKQLILQYTKTTDSPVAIGIDTDYSTEEKIVGTWIDGKPVYQKTIVLAGTDWGTSNKKRWYNLSSSISNLKEVISSDGFIKINEGSQIVSYVFGASDTFNDGTFKITSIYTNNSLGVTLLRDGWAMADGSTITIKYTKTTD